MIGRLFSFAHLHGAFPLLGAPAELRADLDELAALELTPIDTPEPELAYLFKHIVTQEVAYESLTAQARAGLHEQLAVYLERLAGDDTTRFVDLLAYHYERSDNLAKKRVYLRRAGEAAAARYANEAAVEYLSRALGLAPEDEWEERYELLLVREKLFDLQMARDAQEKDLTALEALADLLDDNERRAVIAVRRTNSAYLARDIRGCMAAAAKAVALASIANRPAAEAEAYWRWASALTAHGDHTAAWIKANASLALARAVDDRSSAANALLQLGDIMKWQGDYASAHGYYKQGLQMMRALGDHRGEGVALSELANIARAQQDFESAQAYCEQSLRLFLAIGDRWGEKWILGHLGLLVLEQGDITQAQAYLRQSLHIVADVSDRPDGAVFNAELFVGFGWAMQCLGDYAAAQGYYEQGLEIARASNDQQIISMIFINLGTLARNQGGLGEARAWYAQAVNSARLASNEHQEGVGLWGLGNVALDARELDAAANSYRAAVALFEQIGHHARVIETLAGLALVAVACADLAAARASVETIVDYLAHGSLTFENVEEPFQVELSCYRVLDALGDPRAPAMLESAYSRLQDRAAGIPDANLRRSYLENVPYHRQLVAAWESAQPGEKT